MTQFKCWFSRKADGSGCKGEFSRVIMASNIKVAWDLGKAMAGEDAEKPTLIGVTPVVFDVGKLKVVVDVGIKNEVEYKKLKEIMTETERIMNRNNVNIKKVLLHIESVNKDERAMAICSDLEALLTGDSDISQGRRTATQKASGIKAA